MGRYKDRVNFEPHAINNTTITLNGETVVTGLEVFEAELDEDETTVDKAGDGTAIFVKNASRSGQIRIQFLEAASVTDAIYTLLEADTPFKITALDSAAPNFDVRGNQCMVMKRPAIRRELLPDKPEWILACTYLNIKGGSYALATA